MALMAARPSERSTSSSLSYNMAISAAGRPVNTVSLMRALQSSPVLPSMV
jgi:hypothetical protein